MTQEFAQHHDDQIFQCLCEVLHVEALPPVTRSAAPMPLTLGGLG